MSDPEAKTLANGAVKACCLDLANLELTEKHPDKEVKKCKVCGCRHFRVFPWRKLEPGSVPIG